MRCGGIPAAAAAGVLSLVAGCASTAPREPDARTLLSIASDIERLGARFAQLADFSAQRNTDPASLAISYEYHTHAPARTGGWSAGVPNPDDDGLWFHIHFHAVDSTAQIDTQPVTITPQCLGDMRVGFLILEGARAPSVNAALWRILRAHGVAECTT